MKNGLLKISALIFFLVTIPTAKAVSQEAAVEAPEPAAAIAETDSAPQLVFEEKGHDFGEIKPQQSVKHIFTFKNAGTALLVIEKVKATCGCTGTLLSAEEIPPGEDGEIEVTFKPGRSGGKKKKMIYVYSNDPKNPSEQLYISANIIVPVEIRPAQIYWVAEENEPSKKVIELFHQPKRDIKIVKLETSSTAFKATATPKKEGATPGYDIEVSFDGSLPTGNFREKLTVSTNDPEYETLSVYIRGRIEGKIKVVPNTVALGVIKADRKPTRSIHIYTKNDSDFEIMGIESTNPLISTEITSDEGANGYHVTVALTATPPKGAFSEKLLIRTTLDGEKPVEVAVYAFVQ